MTLVRIRTRFRQASCAFLDTFFPEAFVTHPQRDSLRWSPRARDTTIARAGPIWTKAATILRVSLRKWCPRLRHQNARSRRSEPRRTEYDIRTQALSHFGKREKIKIPRCRREEHPSAEASVSATDTEKAHDTAQQAYDACGNDAGPHAASRQRHVCVWHNLHPTIIGVQISSRVVCHENDHFHQHLFFGRQNKFPTNRKHRFNYRLPDGKQEETTAQPNYNKYASNVSKCTAHMMVVSNKC